MGGSAVLAGILVFACWRARRWTVTVGVVACIVCALCGLLGLQLLLVLQRPSCAASFADRQFPYTALTAITMSVNMMPLASIVYLSRGCAPFPLLEPGVATLLASLGLERPHSRWLARLQSVLLGCSPDPI